MYPERPRENNVSVKHCIFVTSLSSSQVISNTRTIGNNMIIQLYRVQAWILGRTWLMHGWWCSRSLSQRNISSYDILYVDDGPSMGKISSCLCPPNIAQWLQMKPFLLPQMISARKWLISKAFPAILSVAITGPTHAKLVSLTSPCCSGWPCPMNTLKANNGPLGSGGCAGFNARLKSDLVLIFYFNSTNE